MKKLFVSMIMAVVCLISVNAQPVNTNVLETVEVEGNEHGKWELTLGGAGVVVPNTGDSQFGLSVSLAHNPFKSNPNVWLGIVQELAWEPIFVGATDIYSAYSWHLYKELWMNTGWSVGSVYDTQSSAVWRTGPLVEFEYYVGENAFIVTTFNYDFMSRGDGGLRYSFGIGITF